MHLNDDIVQKLCGNGWDLQKICVNKILGKGELDWRVLGTIETYEGETRLLQNNSMPKL